MSKYRLDTTCVQGGYRPGNGEPRQIPIVQSTTFRYETSEAMGRLFDLEDTGYFYTRLQNPTNDTVAAKIAEMEGGTAAMLTSSGQAANFFALFNVWQPHCSVFRYLWRNVQSDRSDNEKNGDYSDIRSTRLHRRRTECSIPG